jgi:hypothetical protein
VYDEVTGQCYRYFNGPLTSSSASGSCFSIGALLATVRNSAHLAWLQQTFNWAEDPFVVDYVGTSYPTNKCPVLTMSSWFSDSCQANRAYICEATSRAGAFAPTFAPTVSPTILTHAPTSVPSSYSSPNPTTATPTREIISPAVPQQLYAYPFDAVASSSTLSHGRRATVSSPVVTLDTVDSFPASLFNIPVTNSRAVFNGQKDSYIQLPYAILGPASAVTVEMWATIDRDNDPSSVLFSFGPPGQSISLKANFSGEEVCIAAVFRSDPIDPSNSYAKVYVNGDLHESAALPPGGLIGGLGLFDGSNFIGRDAEGTSPPLKGSVDLFTLWWGELSPSALFTRYVNATVPSALSLSQQVTSSDVNVVFYSQSTINVEIELVAGPDSLALFEYVPFLIQAVDCDYNITVMSGRAGEPVTVTLAALNYTVTLLPFTTPLALYTSEACYLPGGRCICSPATQPYDYFSSRKILSQSITIAPSSTENISVSFVYRSELCIDVANADSLPVSQGDLYIHPLQSCYPKNTTFLKQSEKYEVRVIVYERYPCDVTNIEWKYLTLPCAQHSFDVLNISLLITSDWQGVETSPYTPSSQARSDVGHIYSISPSTTPRSFPSTYNFAISAVDSVVGIAVTRRWVIPVTGFVPSDRQRVIPMVSDPNLIFFVLRDPPGGTSTTTFKSCTSFSDSYSLRPLNSYYYSILSFVISPPPSYTIQPRMLNSIFQLKECLLIRPKMALSLLMFFLGVFWALRPRLISPPTNPPEDD